MKIVDELVTVYSMNASSYKKGATDVQRSTGQMVQGARSALGVLAAMAGGAGVVGVGVSMMKTAANIEALKMGLASMLGSAAAAEAEFRRLREVAKMPGLGLEEAAKGEAQLLAAGLAADQARAALMAFGNAIALTGGGKDELNHVILALSQIAAKGKVMGQDIMQIQEQVGQLRPAMKAAFGTSDTEELQKMGVSSEEFITKIIAQLSLLPKATSGAKNAFETIGDSFKVAFAAGGSALNRLFVPAINRAGEEIDRLAGSGALEKLANQFTGMFDGKKIEQGVAVAIRSVFGFVSQLPEFFKKQGPAIKSVFSSMVDAAKTLLPAVRAIGQGALALLRGFNALPGPIKTALGVMLILRNTVAGSVMMAGINVLKSAFSGLITVIRTMWATYVAGAAAAKAAAAGTAAVPVGGASGGAGAASVAGGAVAGRVMYGLGYAVGFVMKILVGAATALVSYNLTKAALDWGSKYAGYKDYDDMIASVFDTMYKGDQTEKGRPVEGYYARRRERKKRQGMTLNTNDYGPGEAIPSGTPRPGRDPSLGPGRRVDEASVFRGAASILTGMAKTQGAVQAAMHETLKAIEKNTGMSARALDESRIGLGGGNVRAEISNAQIARMSRDSGAQGGKLAQVIGYEIERIAQEIALRHVRARAT